MRSWLSLAALVGGGCTWITAADVESRRPTMDDDRDGFVKSEDCNDDDPDILPGTDETWYDGIDQDCAQDDDYDADADGYVPDAYAGLQTKGVSGSGGLPGGDCNDGDPVAYPGAADVWYDGVDSDCGGEDDHDADGDLFVEINHGGLVTENVPGSGQLPEGDCDDADARVNPAASDAWYDGVDTDCQGEDDYDQDADGYYPADVEYGDTRYVPGSGSLLPGDCDDFQALVNPGAVDDWYTGVDEDCGGEDDYDADTDGYVPSEYDGLKTLYADGSGTLPSGDCDDSDPTVLPGAIEVLGDTADQDCDGDPDTFIMRTLDAYIEGVDEFTWDNAHDLRMDGNSGAVFLAVATTQVDYGPTGDLDTAHEAALAVGLELDEDATYGVSGEVYEWFGNSIDPNYELTDGHDFLATDDAIFGAVGFQSTSNKRYLVIGGYDLKDDKSFNSRTHIIASGSDSYEDFDDMSLAMDADENLHLFACEKTGGVSQYMAGTPDDVIAGNTTAITGEKVADFFAEACEIQLLAAPLVTIWSTPGNSLDLSTLDPSADDLATEPLGVDTTLVPADLDVPRGAGDDWLVLADELGGSVVVRAPDGSESTLADGSAPIAVHAVYDAASERLVIGYIDGDGDPWMAWGTPETGFDSYAVVAPFSGATEIAVDFDPSGQTVMVGLLGADGIAFGIAGL